ncbi:MAG: hypothetical protein HZA59_10505 [Hydrogenophilales bacterium]|nr:hypothetical protein [Hydrogenophilales bacterium]
MSVYLPLFNALNEAQVQYVVVGGLATVLHGYARMTADVDLVINLEQGEAQKAVSALLTLGLKPRLPVDPMQFANAEIRAGWIKDKHMLVFSFYDPANPLRIVDLFVHEPIPYEDLSRRAISMNIDGTFVPVCDIADLIELKRRAARPRDLDDIQHLEELLRTRKLHDE